MSRRARPTLLIASLDEDLHALLVQADLRTVGTVECRLLATDALSGSAGLSWTNLPGSAVVPVDGGDLLPLTSVDAIWWRRSGTHQVAARDNPDPAVREVIDNDSHTSLLGALMTDFLGRWVSHPEATRRAENKLIQLRVAREAGLRTPATLVSQDPRRIREFSDAHSGRVIVKAVRGTHRIPVPTQYLTGRHLAHRRGMSVAPAMYQELIPGDMHLRVLCLGDDVFAVRFCSPDLDWRPGLTPTMTPVELEPPLQRALVDVGRRLDLRMGVVDLKVDAVSGEPVWLEINPQGQFFFMEGLSGLDLRGPVARFMTEETLETFGARAMP